ncbi:DUF1214 domain-containing protein [Psychroserpens sp.]|uniref:DUF1214 domain-containing protein n=1 Tax=Psychroserpens sp. TaxID=2020870 RepID=UPI001B2AE3B4|nr:DUF1214 domain-containing protein [Psychroserpens sp.]MBO6608041.1 DUF1214 domain-containing protein [Psychroserpens sp.]MBO6631542.1 DUF1214 domain-containing protein [Psychroserpens sp.]MBO6655151.1 DUF1214 domain-containing protein [Psychroserpens sp.]MBO6683251.1 DUF1214 domain-containing protein [Psychroserpens sp.]MBO6751414.1 DUF1214 domain-containing protein [Psychroserpens sp.]
MRKTALVTALIFVFVSCQSKKQKETTITDESSSELVSSIDGFFSETGRIVTPESYPTDETSRQMLKVQSEAGVNNFKHERELTPTDKQSVVRMNRDTYYSKAMVNVSKGATITMPEIPEGKYMSVEGVTEDHRIQAMKYGPGTYELTTHTGTHLFVIIRLDQTFTETEAKEIQDKMVINANSDELFTAESINEESFNEVELALKMKVLEIAKREGVVQAGIGLFTDPRDESARLYTDEKHQVGAAVGWGGAQLKDNVYETSTNFSIDKCYQITFENPKNRDFWSITVYDKNGFMFNDLANFSSYTAQPNEDGTYTISLGCGEDAPNNLEIDNPTGVFNITARHYGPSKRVVEDGYRLVPFIKEVSKN